MNQGLAGWPHPAATSAPTSDIPPMTIAPFVPADTALVLIDHALRHRAQCGDVRTDTPRIPALAPEGRQRLPSPR